MIRAAWAWLNEPGPMSLAEAVIAVLAGTAVGYAAVWLLTGGTQ